MKIPFRYYLKFYLKNTIMASATGAVLGFFIRLAPLPYSNIVGSIIGFLLYQLQAVRYFKGSKRGDFEYSYKGELIEETVRYLIKQNMGRVARIRYFSDSFNNIGYYQLETLKKLGMMASVLRNKESNYAVQTKTAQLYLKEDNIKKEINFLEAAVLIKPFDFIANYRIALAFEKENSVHKAIEHYQNALKDEEGLSDQLSIFINAQIERVKTIGPMTKPSALGLRFSSW